ncbi:MAG TPA: 7-cyano-7-deazaguanine synthase QueC [Candidatus Omnitrophica bacterium]|nr:7-cyano-7-deazaguanine synthase QueC [Candidatus Omnitrophota bacterium]
MKRAIVLNSGGMDSATAMAIAKEQGFSLYSLSFNYGQRNNLEINAAVKIARFFKADKHLLFPLPLGKIGGSALTDSEREVPKYAEVSSMPNGIPLTYVPARNTIFLSFALAWAEVERILDIFIGINQLDYSGYPDCRPAYLEAFQKMANLATKQGVEGKKIKIHAPLINMNKGEIVKRGIQLGVDYSLTWSCYDPTLSGRPCLKCASCLLREKGFKKAGVEDPLLKNIG